MSQEGGLIERLSKKISSIQVRVHVFNIYVSARYKFANLKEASIDVT